MTETTQAGQAEGAETEHYVTVRGQRCRIGASSGEQLALMRMTARRLSRVDPDNITADQAIRMYEKAVQTVTTLLVDRDDRDWLEDLLLSREMELEEAMGVMTEALESWTQARGNRAEKRAATRKKAAAKKSAAKKPAAE